VNFLDDVLDNVRRLVMTDAKREKGLNPRKPTPNKKSRSEEKFHEVEDKGSAEQKEDNREYKPWKSR